MKVTIVDNITGYGKTTAMIEQEINGDQSENILYVSPYLSELERIVKSARKRRMFTPENKGRGKIGNIAELLRNQVDIAATHELFRRFDSECKDALRENEYTLILDETLTAVEPYYFQKRDDFRYLLENGDVAIDDSGLITWTGKDELDTRFNDVRILSENRCLFKVNDKFFLWHFPVEIFRLFKKVYVLTYMFEGSLMKPYFDLYGIEYQTMSVARIDGKYTITDYYQPDKEPYRKRLNIYEGRLTDNISKKRNTLSATWCKKELNAEEMRQIQKNIYNFCRHIVDAPSNKIMWTCYKSEKNALKGKGYSNGFLPCNARAMNGFQNKTCLVYACNYFENPEIIKFFGSKGITVDQDAIALSTIIQWIWRSNIRVADSEEVVDVYIPSIRMRELFKGWLES